jgi:hypothetical protein
MRGRRKSVARIGEFHEKDALVASKFTSVAAFAQGFIVAPPLPSRHAKSSPTNVPGKNSPDEPIQILKTLLALS